MKNVGVFDELVVGEGRDSWIHLEQMSRNAWWMRLGEHGFDITIGDDGKATVYMRAAEKTLNEIAPGDYQE